MLVIQLLLGCELFYAPMHTNANEHTRTSVCLSVCPSVRLSVRCLSVSQSVILMNSVFIAKQQISLAGVLTSVCLSLCLSLPPFVNLRRLVGDWEAPLVLANPRDTAATVTVGTPRGASPTSRSAGETDTPGRRSEILGVDAAGEKGVLQASGRSADVLTGVESKGEGSPDGAQERRTRSALSETPLDWLSAFSWASTS